MPASNIALWRAKFSRNVERDAAVRRVLRVQGWRVLVLWECETKNPKAVRMRLESFLRSARQH